MLLWILACTPDNGKPAESSVATDSATQETDTDTDSDSDSDTDTDTDSDSDADTDSDADSDTSSDAYDGGTGPYLVTSESGEVDGHSVTWYLPKGAAGRPVMVISHGFARAAKNFATVSEQAASWGFVVATPELPSATDPKANADGIVDGIVPETQRRYAAQVNDQVVLMGHSLGGSATILAGSKMDATAIVALDPVDQMSADGATAAPSVLEPTLVLVGESSFCNSNGNGSTIGAKLGGSHWVVDVTDATHCDFESDTDAICSLGCGAADPSRQSLIDAYALGWALHYTVGGADAWLEGGARAAADKTSGKITW